MIWLQTFSGVAFDLVDPRPDQVRIGDIATQLSRLPRFCGATTVPWSVAQHSVLVARLLPDRIGIYGLLHDAHEAYLGDDTSPKLAALGVLSAEAAAAIRELRRRADMAIHSALSIPFPPPAGVAAAVAHADRVALATEKRDLMAPEPWPWAPLPEPLPTRIAPLPPVAARARFVEAFGFYGAAFALGTADNDEGSGPRA